LNQIEVSKKLNCGCKHGLAFRCFSLDYLRGQSGADLFLEAETVLYCHCFCHVAELSDGEQLEFAQRLGCSLEDLKQGRRV
jgi:hypothetical protein